MLVGAVWRRDLIQRLFRAAEVRIAGLRVCRLCAGQDHAFLVMIIRAVIMGRGAMCMGTHPRMGNAELAEMRREIQALRDELKAVKTTR